MSQIWQSIQGVFASGLELLHGLFEPVFGEAAWGWAIIALTLVVRVGLLPLARKQFTSMRAMQELSPEIKKVQKKYKTDRDLMKKDPERYRSMKAKQNEELQGLYKEHGVNPAAGCLPLLAQAPIFLALFSVLRSQDVLDGRIVTAPFYFFTENAAPVVSAAGKTLGAGLGSTASSAGWPGYLLILLMAGTMFFTQWQTLARTKAATLDKPARSENDGPDMAAQQQKIMLYVMPAFLAVISRNFPLGVLLYWVTTNVWQVAQQALILRAAGDAGKGATATSDKVAAKKPINDPPARKPTKPSKSTKNTTSTKNAAPTPNKPSKPNKASTNSAKRDRGTTHLPSRKTS